MGVPKKPLTISEPKCPRCGSALKWIVQVEQWFPVCVLVIGPSNRSWMTELGDLEEAADVDDTGSFACEDCGKITEKEIRQFYGRKKVGKSK